MSVQSHSAKVAVSEQAVYPRAKPNTPYISFYVSANAEVPSNETFSSADRITADSDGLTHLSGKVIFEVDIPEDVATLQTFIIEEQSETNGYCIFDLNLSATDDADNKQATIVLVPIHSLFPNGFRGHIFTVATNDNGEVILEETILGMVYDVPDAH
jgi:hypothetical protein